MKAYERLLKYAVIKTPSDESSDSTPSSACQFDLANLLKKEMEELVVSNIQLTDNCFLYGKLPATKGYENAPAIGFIAHMDTVPITVSSRFVQLSQNIMMVKNLLLVIVG